MICSWPSVLPRQREARDAVDADAVRRPRPGAPSRPRRCGRWSRSRARAGCPAGRSRGLSVTGIWVSVVVVWRGRRPHLHATVELDVERAPVLGDVDLHRGVRVVVERDLLEVGRGRRHVALLAAVAAEAGRGAQAAEQVRAEVRARENDAWVWPHARVPRAAAVEVRAPRDRVVVVDRVAVLLVVRRLVDRGEDLHVPGPRAVVGRRRVAVDDRGRRVLVVVPLVRAVPAGRKTGRGGLVAVRDVDAAFGVPGGWLRK